MALKLIPITISVINKVLDDDAMVSIPSKSYSFLTDIHNVKLKLGVCTISVQCIMNNTEDCMIISKKTADELSIYSGLKTNLFIKDNILSLGPVIGTFTDSTSVSIASRQRPGNKLRNLSIANKEAATIIYFFSVDDYISEDEKINGCFYNYVTNNWERRVFPLPDILYDRGGGILKKQIPSSQYIRQSIENNENVKRFNPRYFFDKLDVNNKLMGYPKVKNHLPYTIPYKNSNDLLEMFKISSAVYIKDRVGNRGLGVTRVSKYPNGHFELSYYKKDVYKYSFDSFDELINNINELYKGKMAILQSAIDLIRINHGNVDMRATVQRDGNGILDITACPVRVGKAGMPITSTRSGSQVYRFEDFFREFLNYSDEEIRMLTLRVNEFIINVYKCIEDSYGIFGELGIDFAVDNNKNIWFIECNAKPGKDTVYLSYDEATVKKAFLNPLEYSKYLWQL